MCDDSYNCNFCSETGFKQHELRLHEYNFHRMLEIPSVDPLLAQDQCAICGYTGDLVNHFVEYHNIGDESPTPRYLYPFEETKDIYFLDEGTAIEIDIARELEAADNLLQLKQ